MQAIESNVVYVRGQMERRDLLFFNMDVPLMLHVTDVAPSSQLKPLEAVSLILPQERTEPQSVSVDCPSAIRI